MIYTNNKINLLWKPLQKQDVYMFSHDELKKIFINQWRIDIFQQLHHFHIRMG